MTDTNQASDATTDTTGTAEAGAGSAAQTTGQSPTDGGKGAATGGAADKGAASGAGEAGTGGAAARGGKGKQQAEAGTTGEDAPFWEGLPDDLKKEKSLTRWSTVEELARAALAAERRLGVPADQLVRLPTNDEERAAVYGKLGAPDSAEGYKIELPKEATDEDRALADRFANHMFKAGPFPPDVVKASVDFMNAEMEAQAKAEADAFEEAKTSGAALLKKELGAAYDPEMKAVGKWLLEEGGEDLKAELDRTGLGNSPRLMLFLHKAMDARGEPQTLEGGNRGTTPTGKVSPAQARAALQTLESDPVKSKALFDNGHSMHKTVVAERARLLRAIEGMDPD
ncbi:hypothetical protein [Brevundimonas sp. A19_0]|uniref:hypothetical protein n=1 Tax=Brevundimonas sp. A19_0 TaxID=2821087 RepID=UPI001AD9F8A1|nr:hypothetical protein [Brevundimonas sp. A19_0]MBO9502518.1 hypothetical protein [Brevundimonas sp. A19_0]